MARLFVAVQLRADVHASLSALPMPDLEGARWVDADNWHITLRFLGDVDPELVSERLAGVRLPRARAELGPRVGLLGRGVVMVPVAGLDSLARRVTEATADLGRPPDARGFHGHVTLARLRRPRSLSEIVFGAEFDVNEVVLVDSSRGDAGSLHRTVASFALPQR
ncbi:MAG: RNA 2',3'-cyclic phosphodiesterase [Actinomycetia bacterium]|nr:RNA 2',3'-cyclic phosphodiesterase [Actinomycetes bacterium]MCP4959788.1 RNA 2',3'-cyclic phosphodiesterase [Actinomycetes bacterium]